MAVMSPSSITLLVGVMEMGAPPTGVAVTAAGVQGPKWLGLREAETFHIMQATRSPCNLLFAEIVPRLAAASGLTCGAGGVGA